MECCLQRASARTKNRSHARRFLAVPVALVAVAMIVVPASAAASVTIGQVAPSPPSPSCTSDVDYLQPSVTAGNLYVARQAGTITSWTTNSSGSGGRYVIKIFRRTPDPDIFQVMAHASSVLLSNGINTVPVRLPVKSGDMIGLNQTSGPSNACTFSMPGDSVLTRSGDLADGSSGVFSAQNDVRLNLSAVVVPDNHFTLAGITRDRKQGTAQLTATTTNPGLVTMSGKGLRKRRAKSLAVAGPVTFQLTPTGRTARRLARKGVVTVSLTVTFSPTGGDPSSQSIRLKLRKRKLAVTPI